MDYKSGAIIDKQLQFTRSISTKNPSAEHVATTETISWLTSSGQNENKQSEAISTSIEDVDTLSMMIGGIIGLFLNSFNEIVFQSILSKIKS